MMPKNDAGSVGIGLARFGEIVPSADELKRRAARLEQQAADYRAMAEAAKKSADNKEK